MTKSKILLILSVSIIFSLGFFAFEAMASEEVPRMTKEDLKKQLDSPDLIVLDVRIGKDWKASEFKIKGAVRDDPTDLESWANTHSKDKTLVLYCA